MTLAYVGTQTLTSSVQDACNRESSNEIVSISRASPDKLERWAISNLAQQGTTFSLTNNSQASTICMVDASSACVWTSTTNMDVVDLTSNYKVNKASGVTASNVSQKGQQSAGIVAFKLAIATSSTANTINRYTGSTHTASTQTILNMNGGKATTIVALASSWIIGTDNGALIELDTNFLIVKSMQIPQQLDNTTLDQIYITGLSYSNGVLAVQTAKGFQYQVSWYTREVLSVLPCYTGAATNQSSVFCAASSGTTLTGIYNTGTSTKAANYIFEYDITQMPPKIKSTLFVASTQNVITCGIQSNMGWALLTTTTLINFSVIPARAVISQTPSALYNGTYRQNRRIVIINNGVGATSVESDMGMPANSTSTFPITASKGIIEIATFDTGVSKLGGISVYST